MTDPALSDMTRQDFDEAEAIVAAGRETFIQVGQALLAIRDRRGYRHRGYVSFDRYLEEHWHMSRRTGFELVADAEVRATVESAHGALNSNNAVDSLEFRPGILAPLASLPPDQQIQAFQQLVEQGHATRAQVRSLARALHSALSQPVSTFRADPEDPQALSDMDDVRYRLEVADARMLPLETESAHLVVTSPPFNCRLVYADYEDWLPWDDYWEGLIAPALREAYRILVPGGRLCLNLPNVIRQDVQVAQTDHDSRAEWQARGMRKWTPPGAEGRPWSVLVERHLWGLMEDIGFVPRERITWVKGAEPENVVSQSTAWGTWCSAENPVLRAVAEPVFIASKLSFAREPGQSDLTADEFKAWTRNAWFIPAVHASDTNGNPAALPEELPRRLIKLYSYPDDLVVDPFVGGGTTVIASCGVGRRAYGYDIGPREIARSRRRLATSLGRAA